jgi:hypothetical protein
MTRQEAQKAYEEGWAVDVEVCGKGWYRCILITPEQWSESPKFKFRYASAELIVENILRASAEFRNYKPQKQDLKSHLH